MAESSDLVTSKEKMVEKIIKYPVGSDVNKEIIFNFPYILNKETTTYIKKHARVMFIIRGPPGTGKATLSEMITEEYPSAVFCCADRYFRELSENVERTRQSIKDSHEYCRKKVENACQSNAKTIIVQNTHMRKWEMQIYLDYAAQYNYTVIMAITLYRFDCTPKALAENNTDGLDIGYFQKRLAQWQDVLPLLTGWFISPNDSSHILHHLKESLESLLGDGKFCRICNVFETEDLLQFFKPRKVLCCPAGFNRNNYSMKKYYLSDEVQLSYGKCFNICLLGYLVSPNFVMGIINVDKAMEKVFMGQEPLDKEILLCHSMSALNLSQNLQHFSETTSFLETGELPEATTVQFLEQDYKSMSTVTYCFIDMVKKDANMFDVKASQQEFATSLKDINNIFSSTNCDSDVLVDDDGERSIYRLDNDLWVIKPVKILNVTSIFTGLYI